MRARLLGLRTLALAGTPSLTVPVGDVREVPLGITFMGSAYSEPELLALGLACEQGTNPSDAGAVIRGDRRA